MSACKPRLNVLQRPISPLHLSHHNRLHSSSRRRVHDLHHFISKEDTLHPRDGPRPFSLRLAVKDNIATCSDLSTTCASSILSSYRSPIEATIVSQLRWRGYMVVGKTNLDEFGMGSHSINTHFGEVHQPEPCYGLSCGGSSGGSAVAVLTGDADLALGTDTGGSVRLPASYTGTVGYKPSYGMISRYGVIPYANSFDTVGFMARQVDKIASVIMGPSALYLEHDPKDPTSVSPSTRKRCIEQREGYSLTPSSLVPATSIKDLTIGIPLEYNCEEVSASVRATWLSTAALFLKLGARVVPVSLPMTRHALSTYYVLGPAEASSNLAKFDGIRYGTRADSDVETATADDGDGVTSTLYAITRGKHLGLEVQSRILLGSYILSADAMESYFVQAQRVRRLVRDDFDRIFKLNNPLVDEEDHKHDISHLPNGIELHDKHRPAQVDFLLCPTASTTSPTLKEVEEEYEIESFMNDVFTVGASLAGLPAISLPFKLAEKTDDDKKKCVEVTGMQLIGQYWDDARLLSVADQLMKTAEAAEMEAAR